MSSTWGYQHDISISINCQRWLLFRRSDEDKAFVKTTNQKTFKKKRSLAFSQITWCYKTVNCHRNESVFFVIPASLSVLRLSSCLLSVSLSTSPLPRSGQALFQRSLKFNILCFPLCSAFDSRRSTVWRTSTTEDTAVELHAAIRTSSSEFLFTR